MEVNAYRFRNINIRELSAFIMEVKKACGQWQEETTLDNVEDSINRNFADTNGIVLIGEENGETRGCLVLHLKEGNQAEINPWFLGGLPMSTFRLMVAKRSSRSRSLDSASREWSLSRYNLLILSRDVVSKSLLIQPSPR